MTGALTAAVVIVAATVYGLIWRRRNGMLKVIAVPDPGPVDPDSDQDQDRLESADLRADLGERATLVQFSTAFCAPCRATRTLLADLARTVDGVAYVDIDAESRLELVRRLGILRTPTVLILDARGRIRARASGLPRRADVIAALGGVVTS